MEIDLSQWSLILLCFSMAGAFGGGLYEHIVLTPLWSRSPPSSFSIIQRGMGVPLQRFWIPVHVAITIFILLALFLTWNDVTVRRLLLIGLASYAIMRVWSGLFFIREMLAFQKIPPDSAPSAELSARVARWRLDVVPRASRYDLPPLLLIGPLLAGEVLKRWMRPAADGEGCRGRAYRRGCRWSCPWINQF